MLWIWSNFAASTLLVDAAAADLTLEVAAIDGALFPEPGEVGEQFNMILGEGATQEIVTCTARVGGLFTVTRGTDQTSALDWPAGTPIRHEMTAEVARWMSTAALDFNRRYIGYGPIDPTTDANGDELQPGMIFFNTQDREMKYWDEEWIPFLAEGSAGATVFTDLEDVPSDYTGFEGFWLRVKEDGTGIEFVTPPVFQLSSFKAGTLEATERMLHYVFPPGLTVTFDDDFASSSADIMTAADDPSTFSIKKNGAQIGTLTVTGTTPVFVTAAGATTYEPGDVLEVTAPGVPDATLADVSIVLVGQRVYS